MCPCPRVFMCYRSNRIRQRGTRLIMPDNNGPEHCSRCGKPFQQVTCLNCGGNGYRRGLLFWKKKICGACQGRGTIRRCPDFSAHAREKLLSGIAKSTDPRSRSPFLPSRGKEGTGAAEAPSRFGKHPGGLCPVCKGSGCVKTMGSLSPCPVCRPVDHDRWRKTQMPPPLGHPWWKGSGRK